MATPRPWPSMTYRLTDLGTRRAARGRSSIHVAGCSLLFGVPRHTGSMDRDLAPGVRRPDGPFVDDLEFPLIVFSNQGQRIVDQNLRIRGEYVIMLGMLPGQAFIARSASEASRSDPVRIVSRSLSSGQERALLNSDLPVPRGDAAGRHLVFGGDGPAGPPTAMTSPNCWV